MSSHCVLLVAGEETFDGLVEALASRGWSVEYVVEVDEAKARLRDEKFACVVVADDEQSSRVRDILALAKSGCPIIGIVNSGDVDTAVAAMRLGAHHVISRGREGWVESIAASVEGSIPKGAAPFEGDPRDIILRSEHSPLNAILKILPQVARSDSPVFISGESGAGKELIARVIHHLSNRASGPFVAVNSAAIPETLLEAELFGHVKGAFTGAHEDRPGLFRSAHEGTIFLDEIGELPQRLQVKLLRVLQDKKVTPVGSSTAVDVDFRVITATNRDLEAQVEQGQMRDDLYYRISVLPLHVPPLRDRREDIPVLAEYFLQEQNRINNTRLMGITRETLSALKRYEWPGNIRELQNQIQRLAVMKGLGYIELEDLPPHFYGEYPQAPQVGLYVPSEGLDMTMTLEKLEASLLKQALQKADGNKAQAARLLGLNRTTLVEKVKRLHVEDE